MKSSKMKKMSPPEESSSNNLPGNILVRIISFLPLEDAVKTSAVARSWRNGWHSVKKLDFDMVNFHRKIPNKSAGEVCKVFSDLISNTLLHRRPQQLALYKFRCRCLEKKITQHCFDSWLQPLIAAKVVELELDFGGLCVYSESQTIITLDSPLFFDLLKSSVEVLRVNGVYLRFPRDVLSSRLESIRELHLGSFNSTDQDIADLIGSCVHLQSLSLEGGNGLQNLKIVSKKLKHLELYDFKIGKYTKFSVEICAPSLISIDLSWIKAEKLALKRPTSLVKAKIRGFEDYKSHHWTNLWSCICEVESLSIENTWPYQQFQQGDDVFSEAVVFHNLKYLTLHAMLRCSLIHSLEILFKQCPQLETMVIDYDYLTHKEDDFPKDIVFQVPRLRLVEIKWYVENKMGNYIVELLKKYGVVLEKIVAYPYLLKADGKAQPPIVL